ncbi:MAG: chromate transporter [Armatimonadetes bacterium]|nr:chromate transporter [Armatimonadota bacterium]
MDDLAARRRRSSQAPFRPSLFHLGRVWLGIGWQSFGGGASTFALIERAVVRERGWLTEAEYVHDVALAQLSPGINLLGLTILIGRRLGGVGGIFVSLLGLLLPSVTITVLMTAAYARLQHLPAVQSALRGVIPATVGLGLLTAANLARALLAAARREGRMSLCFSLILLAGSGLVLALWHPPVILVLCGAGLLGAVAGRGRGKTA